MQISDAEWIVMNLIWQSGPIDAAEVVERLAEVNGWSPATVKTMLHRLVKKGALSHQADGKKYLYRAGVRRHDCIRKASRSFLERVFGGRSSAGTSAPGQNVQAFGRRGRRAEGTVGRKRTEFEVTITDSKGSRE